MKWFRVIVRFIGGLIILLISGAVLLSVFENRVPTESELSQYPSFNPFLVGRTGFRGIRHNLDTGFYSFAFPISFATPDDYFVAVHSEATRARWELVETSQNSRKYQKFSDGPWSVLLLVTLKYDPANHEVVFVEESGQNPAENNRSQAARTE